MGGAQKGKVLHHVLCKRASRQTEGKVLQDHPIISPHISLLHLQRRHSDAQSAIPCAAAKFESPVGCTAL